MTPLRPHRVRRDRLERDLAWFERFLRVNTWFEESDFTRPLRRRPDICTYIGDLARGGRFPDRYRTEVQLPGSYRADLVAGCSHSGAFVFVEFEDAKSSSLFSKKRGRETWHWSQRLEGGFSQIVDWYEMFPRQMATGDLDRDLHVNVRDYEGYLILGRNNGLMPRNQERLGWRATNININQKPIWILTYDELLGRLKNRFVAYCDMLDDQ